MEVALAHANLDFDSLAAQFAVTKLHPSARMAPGHQLAGNVRSFLTLHRASLPVVELNYLDLDKVRHLYIVDCQQAERLEEPGRVLVDRCTYTIFDHHTLDQQGLGPGARADSVIRMVGSSTTLLVEEIIKRQVALNPFEATLLAIGIYEDTGCLTYAGTTEADARCVAHLLAQGADLCQVNNFINPKLTDQQIQLFQRLIRNTKVLNIAGVKVLLSHGNFPDYIEGLATMTRRLLELTATEAAVTVTFMRDRIHVVARSDTPAVDVRKLAIAFGGDGHRGAASAVSKSRSVPEVLERVEALLREQSAPQPSARDIMTSPVRTIRSDISMDEAGRLMLRYGEDGLVVVEEGAVLGAVSRQDVDKAVHHKLAHAPVSGFMHRPLVSATEDATLGEIQQLMVHEDVGRLPILSREGNLTGLVTRRDLLRTLYGESCAAQESAEARLSPRTFQFADKLSGVEPPVQWLFGEVGRLAECTGMTAYAVGGCVRDLLLGLPNFDLDFVVEGSAIELAAALESAFPARFQVVARHDRFQTATLLFRADRKREVDLSTARTEFYEFPAALPTVEPSGLEQDLWRRDFSMNALAVCLNPGRYGEVVDFFDGIGDIEKGVVRILHAFSFIEDPTRIIRAVRFAVRLGFVLEPKTRQQAEQAINMGIFDNLSGFRLKEELRLILESPRRRAALELLHELGGDLRYLSADLVWDEDRRTLLRRAERLLERYALPHEWIIYLGVLLAGLAEARLHAVLDGLFLSNEEKEWICRGHELTASFEPQEKRLARSSIYTRLEGHAEPTLAIAACLATPGSPVRRAVKLYLEELRNVHITLSGNDLLKMGLPQGPLIKEALSLVHAARLDKRIHTRDEELELVRKHYPDYKE